MVSAAVFVVVSVYPLAATSILQPAYAMTPLTAVSGFVVHPRTPVLGFVPIESVVDVVLSVVTTLPPASSTLRTGWVPNATPPVIDPPGCVVEDELALPDRR